MKEYKYIKLNIEDHVALLTMSHAPVNVLTFDMLDEMYDAFECMEERGDVWAVVVNSDQKLFAAGVDLKYLLSCTPESNYDTSARIQKVFLKMEHFRYPVICAIHGICMGGGLEMALSCDLRVFDANVKIAFPETGLGICTGAGGSQRITKLVGSGIAKRMIYTGEAIKAEEALRLGICEYVSEEGKATEKALEVAKLICTKGPLGVACAKKCIEFAETHDLEEGLEYENKTNSELFTTEDEKEGISAFFEKRKACFKAK